MKGLLAQATSFENVDIHQVQIGCLSQSEVVRIDVADPGSTEILFSRPAARLRNRFSPVPGAPRFEIAFKQKVVR